MKYQITTSLRFLLTAYLILCLFYIPLAQQAKQYTYTHFTTANGLPSNLVNSMVQDEEGYMWFATINGISRYDGYRFLNFVTPHNSPSFVYGDVAQLFYDRNHDIWFITTDYRMGVINSRDFTFREVNAQLMKQPAFQDVSFFETQEGTVLVQQYMGPTYRYDALRNRFVTDSTTIPFPKGWRGSKIVWDPYIKKYWLSADNGLALYNPQNKALSYRDHNVEQDSVIARYAPEVVVMNLLVDKSGNLNFYTWPPTQSFPVLHSYSRQRREGVKYNLSDKIPVGYHEINGMLQQRTGRMWVYGHPVFTEWLPDRKSFIPIINESRTEQSLKYDNIKTAFEDGEQNIWLATDNGLFLFNPDAQLFNSYGFTRYGEKEAFEYPANTTLQLEDSSILVGCWSNGIFRFDKHFDPLPVPASLEQVLRSNNSIWDIHLHSITGDIWITLQGGELIVYDPKTGRAQKYSPAIFNKRTIRQITEDREGNLLFGTHHGSVIKWDYKKSNGNPNESYTALISKTGIIHKLMMDLQGYLWVATFGHGLYKVDTKKEKVVHQFLSDQPRGRGITNDVVTDILQYNSNTIIAVSKSLNLIDTRTNQVKYITTAEGLPSNTGLCIEKDVFGILWVGLQNGLCRLNIREGLFNTFNRSNGIEYDNFNPAGAFHLGDGRIIFTTDHNVLVLDPNKFLVGTGIPPAPEFCSFLLSGKPLSVDSLLNLGKVELNYDNSSVALQFSVLSYLKQKQPNYSYILENFDEEWTLTNGTNEAIYSYLPPGTYTFKVKAVNREGISNGLPTELEIIVKPPFWRTWWFYGLIILMVILMLYLIDRERQKRQQALQAVRTQIAGDLHEEINTTLNDINLLSEIAKIKADKDIDRSKDYIDQISTKSSTMIESMDDILWSINPENDSMQRMLLRIYEFNEGIKKTEELDVELTVDKEVERLVLDMKTRHEFLLFYKDAVAYVILHSVCSTIYISMEYLKGKLGLKLLAQCNQLDNLPLQTNQLEYSMQRRADALNGLLDIMSDRKSISIILQVAV